MCSLKTFINSAFEIAYFFITHTDSLRLYYKNKIRNLIFSLNFHMYFMVVQFIQHVVALTVD